MNSSLLAIAVSTIVLVSPNAAAEDASIRSGLNYIRQAGENWIDKRGCVSCHQVPSMLWAHQAARSVGIESAAATVDKWSGWSTEIVNFVKPGQKADCDRQATMAANIDTMAALLLSLPPVKDAQWRGEFARKLVAEQAQDGSWRACGQLPMQRRPKLETHATTTLWTALALLNEGTEFDAKSAIAFSEACTDPVSVEFCAVRLLVADHLDQPTATWEQRLKNAQNDDGGWGWKMGDPSDALGTGYVLYALAKTGAERQVLDSARDYLIGTQTPSGKWSVPGTKSSAKGRPTATANDWGTAWAVIALSTVNE